MEFHQTNQTNQNAGDVRNAVGGGTLLEFRVYNEERVRRTVHIDPARVVSVEEYETRQAFGGYWQVARITMDSGAIFVVEDGSRRVAKEIAAARRRAE